MPTLTVQQAFDLALQQHSAGKLAEAEVLYRQILNAQPGHAEALHKIGIIACQVGRHDVGVEWIRKAIHENPNDPTAHSNLGTALAETGDFEGAIAASRRALELRPDDAENHYRLGNLLLRRGRVEEASIALREAVRLREDFADAWNDLGSALKAQGRINEALEAYRRATELNRSSSAGYSNIGNLLVEMGRLTEAVSACRKAIELQPNYAAAYSNLGNALVKSGSFDEGIQAFRRAAEVGGRFAPAYGNLGNALVQIGETDEGILAFQKAIEIEPNFAEAHNSLGNAFMAQNRLSESILEFQRAIAISPDFSLAYGNLGLALMRQERLDEAIAAFQKCIQLSPASAKTFGHLAEALLSGGRVDESLSVLRKAVALHPESSVFSSGLIFTLQFAPNGWPAIADEMKEWNRKFGDPVRTGFLPGDHEEDGQRQLRIGYVSPNFMNHTVAWNLRPLFCFHDRSTFAVYGYSTIKREDEWTAEFREHSTAWRNVSGWKDEAIAEAIRGDKIDILVDLAQHTAENRLPMFAGQPAPVQVSFAGYPASAGVEAIRYRISDRWLESEGSPNAPERAAAADVISVSRGHERVFLIESFWCYDPHGMDIRVNELPATANGCVTFGSLNNFGKINDEVLKLWARVLTEVKGSRLLLLGGYGGHRQRTIDFLMQHGVEPGCVEFVVPCPREDYLRQYHRVDIALDPFPYGGHTTSLDALWMGVPVVSLAGDRPVSRAGLSILNNLGLPELVAFSEDEYVEIAVNLANDRPRLAELRRTLRSRMEQSVLMDGPRFARQIEAAYRAMWREWCGKQGSSSQ